MAAAVAFGIWVGLLWVVSTAGGAVGIPRSDDWSYLLTQFEFDRSGDFVLNNWAVTMLIGQTLVSAPVVAAVGESIAALQFVVAAFSVLALVMTFVVVRRVLPFGWSLFSVALIAASPIFGPSAISFMTDVPALFFLSLSLWLGSVAGSKSGKRSVAFFALSVLVAVVAFTFRDYAIIAVIPVAWVQLVRSATMPQRVVSGLVVGVGVLIAGALYSWRHSLPNDLKLEGWSLEFSVTLVARAAITIALLSVPVLAAIRWRRALAAGSFRITLALAGSSLFVAGVVAVVARLEFLGNVVHPFGSTWLVSGSGIRLWPLWINRSLFVLGTLALALLLVLSVRWLFILLRTWRRSGVEPLVRWSRGKPSEAVVVLFPVILLGAHASATLLLGTWFIDRYFILVLPFLAAAVLTVARRFDWLVKGRMASLPIAVLILYGVWGFYVTDFDARFDGARWEAGRELERTGLAPETIDAGMQWVSYHALDVGLGAQQVPTREGRPWWTERYPDQTVCATVVSVNVDQTLPDSEILTQTNVRTLFGTEYVLVGVRGPDAC